jgi:pimeloyl-ACP methyl ester carboxylesterase
VGSVRGPDGPLECVVTGSGEPVTVFAHGFAGSIGETRPFGSGVHGTRVFFHFRAHGASAPADLPWTYAGLAAELRAVRAAYGASRGLGVSLGAGALLRSAVSSPDTFERLVVVLPPALDRPRSGRALERVQAMGQHAASHDVEGLTALLLAEQPEDVRRRRATQIWARSQAERLSSPALRDVIGQIPGLVPLEDRGLLTRLTAPVLLIGQEEDEAHPSSVVHEIAEVLPNARVEIFSPGGVLWTHRARLRSLVSGFLND